MPGRPREFDPDQALEAACQHFWTHGYDGASISTLMDEMGINKQSAYNTFGDKQQLFLAALRQYAEGKKLLFTRALDDSKTTPLDAVRNFLSILRAAVGSGSTRGCLLTNTIMERGQHDAESREFVSGMYRTLESRLAVLLARAIERGQVSKKHDPQRLARMILSVMQGAIVLAKARMPEAAVDAVASVETMLSMK